MSIQRSLVMFLSLGLSMMAQTYSSTVKADEPYLGEVRWFAGNFAPRGWAKCDGQLLPINQNDALFSLLGTYYGGDGRTTFALPDMRGRSMLSSGTGPGLSNKRLGARSGEETVTLNNLQIPNHDHSLAATNNRSNASLPHDRILSNTGRLRTYKSDATASSFQSMKAGTVGSTGGGQAHNNMQPYITMTCIIAIQGIYPSRS